MTECSKRGVRKVPCVKGVGKYLWAYVSSINIIACIYTFWYLSPEETTAFTVAACRIQQGQRVGLVSFTGKTVFEQPKSGLVWYQCHKCLFVFSIVTEYTFVGPSCQANDLCLSGNRLISKTVTRPMLVKVSTKYLKIKSFAPPVSLAKNVPLFILGDDSRELFYKRRLV